MSRDEDLDDDVDAFVARLAARSSSTIRRAKKLFDDALERELQVGAVHEGSVDHAEGLAAFAEKRGSTFSGR